MKTERRIELISGLSATILGLIGVTMEAQEVNNPLTNLTLSWLLGSNTVPGAADAIFKVQNALLPTTVALVVLGLGSYLHAVHQREVGLALLVLSSAIVIAIAGFMVLNATYVKILFVPPPIVVFVSFLAAASSVCALSSLKRPITFLGRAVRPLMGSEHIRPRQSP